MGPAFAGRARLSHTHFRLWIHPWRDIEDVFDSPARRTNVVGVVLDRPLQNRWVELVKISE